MKTMRRVEVTWVDPKTCGGWITPLEAMEERPAVCVNIGYLLQRNREVLQLVSGYSDIGDVSDVFSIPMANVKKVRVLR